MINCNITQNYLSEKLRMTKRKKSKTCRTCGIRCEDCPLVSTNNGKDVTCIELEMLYPEKAIELIQKWSDENPQNTYLSKLLEYFPNVPLHVTGIPEDICPFHLGFMSKDDCRNDRNCVICWNQPIKNNEEGGADD